MRGEVKLLGSNGTVPRRCSRCGGKHTGGTTRCSLVSIYSPANQPPRWARPEIAERVEADNDEREGL